jgi:hypothetical protein
MNIQEIKESVMRTASRLDEAKEKMQTVFRAPNNTVQPILAMAMMPIFTEDFLVDVRAADVRQTIATFAPRGGNDYREPIYTFDGVERNVQNESNVALHRMASWLCTFFCRFSR